jgi:hypothetical protein
MRRFFLLTLLALAGAWLLPSAASAHIYWTDYRGYTGSIGRANLDGSGVDNQFALGCRLRWGRGIASNSQQIVWGAVDPTDGLCIADSDGSNARVLAGRPQEVFGLLDVAIDTYHAYWTNGLRGEIGRIDLDGTDWKAGFIFFPRNADGYAPVVPRGVDVDANYVYWTSSDGKIGRANIDGSGADWDFIDEPGGGIAVDDQHIYWTTTTSVGRANLDGTGVDPDFITRPPNGGGGLDVDAGHIYWAAGGSAIGRANINGSDVDPEFLSTVGPPLPGEEEPTIPLVAGVASTSSRRRPTPPPPPSQARP